VSRHPPCVALHQPNALITSQQLKGIDSITYVGPSVRNVIADSPLPSLSLSGIGAGCGFGVGWGFGGDRLTHRLLFSQAQPPFHVVSRHPSLFPPTFASISCLFVMQVRPLDFWVWGLVSRHPATHSRVAQNSLVHCNSFAIRVALAGVRALHRG
jgi:hypothetical protein